MEENMQENPTAQTQEEVPLPTPAAEAPPAPELGADEPQPTVAGEEAPPAPEAGEVAPPSWASVADPYDVLELPEFKTHLQRRDRRMEEGVQRDYTQRYEAATKDWESTQAHQTINGLIGNLSARLEASDMEGGERMVARLEKFREPYMEAYRLNQQGVGSTSTATQLFGLLMNNLGVREQDELQEAAGPGSQWKDIIEKYGVLKQKGSDDRAYKKLKDENDAARAAGQQVQQAREGGPVGALAPGSPAGAGKPYSAMTAGERAALTPEQRDALVAREEA